MVGLVLVSHSATLAAGLVELIAQLAPDVTIATAAGTEDGRIGTSADLVTLAVAAADSGDGVVIVPDLGSAVLSVRVALEDAPSETVVLVDAPFVEGAVSAAVTAGTGASLAEVIAAAEEARTIGKF
jgi:phosphoenolpyruvate---glycerone phosphotransferase subunit DhaM